MKIIPTSEEFYSSESLKGMGRYYFPQRMTYHEREKLKSFTYQCFSNSDTKSLERTLIMIAHWMRQGQRISFTEYASQWTEAQKNRTDGNHSTPAMAQQWPFSGKRCISKSGSDYRWMGVDKNRADDKAEVRHAVTSILAEYPTFNENGLCRRERNFTWEHPLDNPCFMIGATSCMRWIRAHGLSQCQIKTFPKDNPTSYGLKHAVENYNKGIIDKYGNTMEPGYITNGSLIAAMVATGYVFKPINGINALFNISEKALKKAGSSTWKYY